MDEPSLGLAPRVVECIFQKIKELNQTGVSILLVEQNAAMPLSIAHYSYIMGNGKIVLQGTPAELQNDQRVRGAYLGLL